jgi:hypothetical protein
MSSPTAKIEAYEQNRARASFKALTAEEFVAADLPARQLLLAPWLPVGGSAMIHGKAGVGKTQLALSVAMSVASGRPFLGWTVPGSVNVLYLDGEMNPSDMQHRLAARYSPESSDPDGRLRIFSSLMQTPDQEPFNLANPKHQANLQPLIDDVSLVVVDNISCLVSTGGVSENEAESWRPVHEWMMRLRSLNKAVLFVHHSGKAGDQRGTSRRTDQLDSVIKISSAPGSAPQIGCGMKIEFEKKRGFYGQDAEPFIAEMTLIPGRQIVWSRKQENRTKQILELARQGYSQSAIAKDLGINKSTVSRRLKANRDVEAH